ncbi:MAG TPA: hypothetical protein VN699_12850 [Pirellulales bacterium]|nr:hypothetical protein [Pirellulales bacterium]
MRIVLSIMLWGWVAAASAAPPAAKQGPPPRKVEVQYVEYADLAVPFTFAEEKEQAVEVQLHVSEDHGANWKMARKAAPQARRFEFRAPKDGEYWFMCRTKYASGKFLPAGPPAATVKVVVDTTQPKLDLSAVRGKGGEVHVRWKLSDANLAPETFKVGYRAAGYGQSWQRVAIDPSPPAKAGESITGEIAFVPQSNAGLGAVAVQAEICDKSKNRTLVERSVAPPGAEAPSADGVAAAEEAAGPTAFDAHQAAGPALVADPPIDNRPPEMGEAFPQPSGARANPFPITSGESPYPRTDSAEWPPQPSGRPAAPARQPLTTVADAVRPPVAGRYPPGAAEQDEQAAPIQGELLPPGVRPHMVNKLEFELLYDVESVGAAGIAQVELWGTRDGGGHWSSFGLDEDSRSPMLVKVDREGIYGFRVVVKTGTGLEGPAPENGDLPDVWVGVDLTKPAASLVSAEQGSGDEAGEMVIVWEADDERLAARPVSLRMSETQEGPWHTIASGLENSGRYVWRIDQRTPKQVYLRLEVRDEAGNVRIDDSTEPVAIERVRPQGRIRDVRPSGEASRQSRTTHNLLK